MCKRLLLWPSFIYDLTYFLVLKDITLFVFDLLNGLLCCLVESLSLVVRYGSLPFVDLNFLSERNNRCFLFCLFSLSDFLFMSGLI